MEDLELRGLVRLLPNEPALLLNMGHEKHLVISDLHIGFEKALSSKGISLPSQTRKTLGRVKALASRHLPDSIILLGDIKHGTSKILLYEWGDIPEFFGELAKLVGRIIVVPGNHDGGLAALLPRGVEVSKAKGVTLENRETRIVLTHGHAWIHPEALSSHFLIMGHHHFTFDLNDESGLRFSEQVWVIGSWRTRRLAENYLKHLGRRPSEEPLRQLKGMGIDMGDPRIVVMPAFNKMLGGRAINREIDGEESRLGPLFGEDLIDPSRTEVFLLDGTLLGRLSQIRKRRRERLGSRLANPNGSRL